MVFAGIYPVEGEDYDDLREALEKLQLNDASLDYQPENIPGAEFRFSMRFSGAVPYGNHTGAVGTGNTTWISWLPRLLLSIRY